MAKRRNAPALFELLRASGTDGGTPGVTPKPTHPTPTHAPNRPPSQTPAHNADHAPAQPQPPAGAATGSSSASTVGVQDATKGTGSKLTLSTPRFADQRAAMPPTEPSHAALKPTTVPAPTKSVEAKPSSTATGTALARASSTRAAPTAASRPATRTEADAAAAPASKSPAKPAPSPAAGSAASSTASPAARPAPEGPPANWKETIERVVQVEGSRVTLTMSTLAAGFTIGGLVIAAVLLWVFGHAAGRSALSEDRAAALSDDAGRAVQAEAPAGGDAAGTVLGDPSELPSLIVAEPSRESRPADRVPTTPVFTRETPPPDPEPEPDAVAEIEPAQPAEPGAPVDTREAGLNYLALGQLSDAAEAERTVAYLNTNGVPAIAVEGLDRAGNTQYRLFTLLGVPGQGFRSNPERLAHQQRVFELGERWIGQERGQLDFSRASQVQWTKYNP